MSEERMIRFDKDMFYTLKSQLDELPVEEEIYDNIYRKEYAELEIAPSRDFKPKCRSLKMFIPTDADNGFDEPLCVSCDKRKDCIYKRE